MAHPLAKIAPKNILKSRALHFVLDAKNFMKSTPSIFYEVLRRIMIPNFNHPLSSTGQKDTGDVWIPGYVVDRSVVSWISL